MVAHQAQHLLPGPPGKPQPGEDSFRQLHAPPGVPVEMSLPILSQRKGIWLSHVVQQHRQAQREPGGHMVHCHRRVGPHVIAVVGIPVGKAHHGQQLRDHHPQHGGVGP